MNTMTLTSGMRKRLPAPGEAPLEATFTMAVAGLQRRRQHLTTLGVGGACSRTAVSGG